MSKRFSQFTLWLWLCAWFASGCSISETLGLAPSPTDTPTPEPIVELPPTNTPKPTATYTPVIPPTPTETPNAPPTATPSPTLRATATNTPRPTFTATATQGTPTNTPTRRPPTNTPTRRPPTLTFTPRPPTATFTPKPPPTATFTPVPLFALSVRWINTGRPYDDNECGNFLNGTRIRGQIKRRDGTLVTGAIRTAIMHQWIKGDSAGPFAYPGAYRDFPLHNDGNWDAEFPRRAQDFEWHIYISVKASDDPISEELVAVSSADSKCGQPGTKNYFVADWIVN